MKWKKVVLKFVNLKVFLYICTNPNGGRNLKFKVMKRKQTKIEIWFDKASQTLFLFGDDKKSHSFLKNNGNNVVNEMIEKIKDDLSSTNDEFPDYLRFLRDDDGTWAIQSFFDENVGFDEDGKPSIVDFMNNIDAMEISLADRGTLN